jgi:hypothetical protein
VFAAQLSVTEPWPAVATTPVGAAGGVVSVVPGGVALIAAKASMRP